MFESSRGQEWGSPVAEAAEPRRVSRIRQIPLPARSCVLRLPNEDRPAREGGYVAEGSRSPLFGRNGFNRAGYGPGWAASG